MIAKEWRDARWKFGTVAALVLLTVAMAPVPMPYSELSDIYGTNQLGQPAANELWALYSMGSLFVLLPLSALLGASLISGESGRETIFLLLSKPVSRTRVLLTKYAVCAAVLLMAAWLGAVLLVLIATVRGYPVGSVINVPGLALSAILMWLGALFILGVAISMSVLFRNLVAGFISTVIASFLVFTFPEPLLSPLYFFGVFVPLSPTLSARLQPISYWFDEVLFAGQSLTLANFAFWLVAATLMLLATLWLFRRKAY